MNVTKALIEIVEKNKFPEIDLKLILDNASRNKILLHILRVLGIEGTIREEQESMFKKRLSVIETISKLMKNYEYAFFKLLKPVSYVPADIDVLVNPSQIRDIMINMKSIGYNLAVKDPYCITMVKGDSIVDFYVHPSVGGMIFLNGKILIEHASIEDFNGLEVRSLEKHVEALVDAAHAIYKEKLYTLNDFFVTKRWVSKKSFKIAEELACEKALRFALSLNELISSGFPETPIKLSTVQWINMLMRKIKEDRLARMTSYNIIKSLTHERSISILVSKMRRETY